MNLVLTCRFATGTVTTSSKYQNLTRPKMKILRSTYFSPDHTLHRQHKTKARNWMMTKAVKIRCERDASKFDELDGTRWGEGKIAYSFSPMSWMANCRRDFIRENIERKKESNYWLLSHLLGSSTSIRVSAADDRGVENNRLTELIDHFLLAANGFLI